MNFSSVHRKRPSTRAPDVASASDFPTLVKAEESSPKPVKWDVPTEVRAKADAGVPVDETPEEPQAVERFFSNKLIDLLDAHIEDVRSKFPDDPPYVGAPEYDEEEEEDS